MVGVVIQPGTGRSRPAHGVRSRALATTALLVSGIQLAFVLVAAAADSGGAATIAPGAAVAPFQLDDQHGVRGGVDERTRLLLLSRDMDAGGIVKEAFAGVDQARFDAAGAVYVADTSGMPALVSRLFAMPGLRKRPYRILIDADGAATRTVPYQSGAITMVRLEGLRVTAVEHARDAASVRAVMDALPAR